MDHMSIQNSGMASWQGSYEPHAAAEAAQAPAAAPPSGKEQDIWTMMKEAREKAREQQERFKLPKNTRYGDAPMEAYARLGRARTQAQVDSAAGYARRRMAQLQSALRQDPENAERIKAAIRQLQKAVGRAGKKKRNLEHERLIKLRQARAEQEHQRREALRQKQELCRRQTSRVIQERGYLREAEIDNRLQDQLSATRMALRAQAQSLSAAVSPDCAARQYAVPAEPAAAEIDLQA